MIPKIIHYCWFGGNPLPELAENCIASWKKYCPEYELKLWNETNFAVNTVPFTAQVASVKKWGFIVDYIRAYVVYNYGGIYLDTDVELLKPLNSLLHNNCFSGFESEKYVNPGNIFAGEKKSVIAKEIMDFYASYNFIQDDGALNFTPSPKIFTNVLLKYGIKQNNTYQKLGNIFTAYPTEYFCPKSPVTDIINITDNTYCIHHYDGSWIPENERGYFKLKRKICRVFGQDLGTVISFPFFAVISIRNQGIKNGIKNVLHKLVSYTNKNSI